MRWFLGLFAVLVGAVVWQWPQTNAEPAKPSPRRDSLELVLLGDAAPVRWELHVSRDGESIPAKWDKAFAALFALSDWNGNGALDKAEAARLPSAFALRQVLWGQFVPVAGAPPAWEELDLNRDAVVDATELADYYRRTGLGSVLVGIGQLRGTQALTDAILKALDTDGDKQVSDKEWKKAAEALTKLDANEDELIGPGELVPRLAYPGATGSQLLTAPHPNSKPDALADQLPLVVLPLRTADTHWLNVVAPRVKQEHRPADWTAWRAKPAHASIRVQLGTRSKDTPALTLTNTKDHTPPRMVIEWRVDEGKLADQTNVARKRFQAAFHEADANTDGVLDPKELGTAKAALLKLLLPLVDRDGNEQLSPKELDAWLTLQEQIAQGHVLLTLLDHGAGLFELLDANSDGALAVRELRSAWSRLEKAGCVRAGRLDPTMLPRVFHATVSHGHPQTPLRQPTRRGPEWFRAMDRNGDGDVSRKEFIGPVATFDKLDTDHDGLLDAQEAARS